MPVTFMSLGEMAAESPPRWRSRISRRRARMSASSVSNSSWVISPSSTCICAASRRSRSAVSSFISVSTAAATLSSTNRMPPISSVSMISMGSASRPLVGALQFQPDVDEVVRRPRSGVLEREPLVLLPDLLDPRVERLLHLASDQERGVHNHAVANRLVRARGDRDAAQGVEDFGDVALGPRLQRGVDQAAVLHPREIGGSLLRRDFVLQPPDVLVLLLDLAHDQVAIPEHLEAEL